MPRRRWTARYGAYEIELTHRWRLIPPKALQTLSVDGELLAAKEATLPQLQSELSGEIETEDGPVRVVGRVGGRTIRAGGQILVEGRKIGGKPKIRYIEDDKRASMRRGGFLGYFFRYGLWTFGVPYGLVMAILNHRDYPGAGIEDFLLEVASYGLAFAIVMSAAFYFRLWKLGRR